MRALERVLVATAIVAAVAVTYAAVTRRATQNEQQQRRAAQVALERAVAEAEALANADTAAAKLAAPQNPDVTVLYSNLPAPERDSARIAFSLEARGGATYLPELLAAKDGWNYRWPDRRGEPMRIWVQSPADPAYNPEWTALVRESFSDWGDLGLPLFFTFTGDSSRAQIHVTWVDRFGGRMTGRTLWQHDQHGWIVGGNIQLSLRLPDGRPVTSEGVRAIARHEVGHLIGLDHTADTTSIMAAQVFVTELSEADRRTARLVYDLPPGKIAP